MCWDWREAVGEPMRTGDAKTLGVAAVEVGLGMPVGSKGRFHDILCPAISVFMLHVC